MLHPELKAVGLRAVCLETRHVRAAMDTIGIFSKQADGGYRGSLRSLFCDAQGVELRPVARESDKSPDFRIERDGAECGAAWSKTGQVGRRYLSVKLDDPSLTAPIFANLVEAEDGYRLIWQRRRSGE